MPPCDPLAGLLDVALGGAVPPAPNGRHMEHALYRMAVRRRLRQKMITQDMFCPFCGDFLDPYGDHGLACACEGDRTHKFVRDVVWSEARVAGLVAERERPPWVTLWTTPLGGGVPRGCGCQSRATARSRPGILKPRVVCQAVGWPTCQRRRKMF